MDKTITQRVKKQREYRLAQGWQKVAVWVPSEADASVHGGAP
jgi:hypothetical protein